MFDLALKVYENTLWQDARAQAYLRRRAISEEVARGQRLGYANGRALLDWLRGRKDSAKICCRLRSNSDWYWSDPALKMTTRTS